MYPSHFEALIELFERLPGVGAKTAQRYAFELLEEPEERIDEILKTIDGVRMIKTCPVCGFLSEGDKCVFCSDEHRDQHTIMVTATPQDVVAIEKTASYNGLYHVLGGLISSAKGVYPEDIRISELLERIHDDTREVIIAVSPTMDGEMTALYLNKILQEKNVTVTRLAHGLPMGSNLDYADELTLIKAMMNRRKVEDPDEKGY